MPFNETAVYMEKSNKHETSGSSSSSRESKISSPTVQCMGKPIDNPLIKYQGCKWEQVFDFDKVIKQIRNAERYYFRGKHDHVAQSGSSKGNSASCSFPRRQQPQVQRLSSNDMHFYGMVPKQPFDVVVCDKCLGIYTKMGFNNHMKLHHPQAWNLISSKASTSKDSVTLTSSDNFPDNSREVSGNTNPITEQGSATPSTPTSSSRHKSSKSGNSSGAGSSAGGSSGGSSRSRSKSKHHHHHHQQQQQSHQRSSSASAAIISTSSHASQASASNAEVSVSSTSSKSSKKAASGLAAENKSNAFMPNPKETQNSDMPIPLFSSPSSSSSASLPPTPKADLITTQDIYPSTSQAAKEKSKASKRKSKNISTPLSLPPPENNESSNSSVEYGAAIAAAAAVSSTPSKSSSKRSKAKGGKDLKQLMEPQLSELDKAISSITGGQTDVLNDGSNSNDNDCGRNTFNTPVNCQSSLGYSAEEQSVPISMQVPIAASTRPQQQQQQTHYGPIQMMTENTNNNVHQQQQQHQQRTANTEDNDNSILTLEDMLDSKFIHAILNTDESEIHFDESELDKVAQQQQNQQTQQQQQSFMQPTTSKRMRYDEQIDSGISNIENVIQQPTLPGKYAAFQQQHQQQQHPNPQAFQVNNLDDIKMYTTAIDAQQYLAQEPHQIPQQHQQHSQQQQEQHQITTIDPIQLQQLLYQQQQQNLNAYAVGGSLEEVTTALGQQHYNDSDVIMCSAEQLHKEGKINAADYATLAALSGNGTTYNNVSNNVCAVNAIAAAAQFQVYNIPSLTDDDVVEDNNIVGNKLNDVVIPQNHYVLPTEGNDEEQQLIYEITANNQVAVISQQRQQQMIAEFFTQAGYDSVDNVNVNINLNSGTMLTDDTATNETKNSISTDADVHINELMDFDFSRLESVKCCSSSSSSGSSDSKTEVKTECSNKFISTNNIADDILLNVYLYSGLPRPMAVNSFGLCKLPQGVATTFRKTLHATRKANNSPISLNANGGATGTSRFSSNISNAKPINPTNYFTALGAGTNSGNIVNEFSIGSITITNQTHQGANSNSLLPQQQLSQKPSLLIQTPDYSPSNVNGFIGNASSTSPPASMSSRLARPKSIGSACNNVNTKHKSSNLILPQNQPKTIIVNSGTNSDQTKFIKRSMISKINVSPRTHPNLTAKQLSDVLLHPSKEKYIQLLGVRDLDKEAAVGGISVEQQRLNNVRQFYERRKRLLNTKTSTSLGYNNQNYSNSHQLQTTATGLKQKFLQQRLLRSLSDCGMDSIKSNSNSANNSNNNDILRVS